MSTPGFKRSALAVVLTNLIFNASATAAQNDNVMETIEVWSTQIDASSLYLHGEDMAQKQADHISDLLRTIPGVDVGGAHSLNQRITIRSMDDKDLNISIDGAKQNSYMYHHMGNLQIHADILKSVDIEIGSNSVIDGGLGGAVRFETKQAKELLTQDEQFGSRLKVSSGTNSGTNLAFTAYGQLNRDLDFLGYVNRISRENYEVGGGELLDAEGNKVAGTDGSVKGLSGDLMDVLFKFGWDLDNNQRVAMSYEKYTDEGDYSYRPDMGLATDLAITNSLNVPLLWPTEFGRDTVTVSYDAVLGEDTEVKSAVYRNTSTLERDESGWAINEAYAAWAAQVKGEAMNTGFNVIAETGITFGPEHTLTYGIDVVEYETDYSAESASGVKNSGEKATSVAVFVQDRIELTSNLALIPGVRFDQYDVESAVVDDTFDHASFALAAEYELSKRLLLKLSTTGLFKGPEIAEVFIGAGIDDTANADIKAETGQNTELALAYQSKLRNQQQLSAGITVFNTQLNDYIYDYAQVPGGGPRDYWKDNIGDMNIKGLETYVSYRSGDFSSQLTFSSAETDLEAFDDYLSLDGARLDREQGNTISGHIKYDLTAYNLLLNWEVHQVADVDAGLDLDGASKDNSKEGFVVNNVSATWKPQQLRNVTFVFGVDNVFDEYYASQSSRTGLSTHPRFGDLYLLDYEPGRNIKATVNYQF